MYSDIAARESNSSRAEETFNQDHGRIGQLDVIPELEGELQKFFGSR